MRRTPNAVVAWMGLALAGCTASSSASLERASELIAPHREVFARFDRWARRAQVTERVYGNRDALRDATFAPVRNKEAVLAAWIESSSRRPLLLALPGSAPPPSVSRWLEVRDPDLGPLRVIKAGQCPTELPGWWRGGRGSGPCVIISRTGALGVDQDLTVTVAFAQLPAG